MARLQASQRPCRPLRWKRGRNEGNARPVRKADDVGILSGLCPVDDLISPGSDGWRLGLVPATAYIEAVVMCVELRHGLIPAQPTGWPAGANRTMAICAKPSRCHATGRATRRAISSPATPRRPI